jgi:FkbM family methyltransferase
MRARWLHSWILRVRPAELADLLKRIFRVRREVVTTPIGLQLWADPVTHFYVQAMRPEGYEPQMSALLKGLLGSGDTFVDIGANEGYFSALAGSAAGAARIFAVEPQSQLIPVIERNLSLNGVRDFTVSRLALSDKAGSVTFRLQASVNTGTAGFYNSSWRGTTYETVPTMPLDDYFAAHQIGRVRVMKVDCEGGEKLVMAGGRKTLRSRCIDILAWEYHPGILPDEDIKAMDAFLKDCGYSYLNLNGQTLYCLPALEQRVRMAAAGG